MCKLEFAKDSLRLIGSSLVGKEQTVAQTKVEAPKKEWTAQVLASYIEQHSKNATIVKLCLTYMATKPKTDLQECRKSILIAMSTCKDHEDIVLLSYKCIQTAGITTDLVRPLLSSMRACCSSKSVQKEGCVLLSKMSSDKVSNKLGELGAIQDIISILRSNMNGWSMNFRVILIKISV